VIERLIDLAADQLGLDPVALRRRNMSPAAAQPYTNPLAITYHSGRYEDTVLSLADWDGFPARRAEAKERGKLRGTGPPIMSRSPVVLLVSAPRSRASKKARSSW